MNDVKYTRKQLLELTIKYVKKEISEEDFTREYEIISILSGVKWVGGG